MSQQEEKVSGQQVEARTKNMLGMVLGCVEGLTPHESVTEFERRHTYELFRRPSPHEGNRPEVITVTVVEPKTEKRFQKMPAKIELRRDFEEVGQGDDWNVSQVLMFDRQPRFLRDDKVTLRSAEDNRVGTKTIYADSNTPACSSNWYTKIEDQERLLSTILDRLSPQGAPATSP